MSATTNLWTPAEREAWSIPETLPTSVWADTYGKLTELFASEAGDYKIDRTPYVAEILDAFDDPEVRRGTIIKASQLGLTTAVGCALGSIIDQHPAPILYIVPTEEDCTGLHGQRLKDTFENTPKIAEHFTPRLNDTRGTLWTFDRMVFRLGWPTASKLGSMPAKFVVFDEIDKIPKYTGKEANPIGLGEKRLDTYREDGAQLWILSTPVLEDDHSSQQFAMSDQRRFWLPCPHCGEFQILEWSGVKFPKEARDPERIRLEHLAYYECAHCAREIRDRHKRAMMRRGRWCPIGCSVNREGAIEGEIPRTTHRGWHISSLYSPWVTFSDLAAEWLEAQGVPDLLQAFVNSRLGEPWKETLYVTKASELRTLEVPYQPGTVPAEAAVVVGFIDVQVDHVWYVFRAFGPGETSWLVEYGRVERFVKQKAGDVVKDQWRDVEARIIRAEFPCAETGEMIRPRLIGIDSGAFTDEVYTFASRFPEILIPTKGSKEPMTQPYRSSQLKRRRKGRAVPKGTIIWWVDSFYYKKKLHRMMNTEPGLPGAFYIPTGIDKDYVDQVTAEESSLKRNRTTGKSRVVWGLKKGRKANHLGDCEYNNLFLAELVGVPQLTAEHMANLRMARRRQAAPAPAEPSRQTGEGWLGGVGGRRGGRGGWLKR